ncbi:DUF6088 family protein [Vibrio diazotrophicus]|uniref:DUF6088 family protein n=1 Tax=Vibrio diazotrophicus TaxID=685 RepID=UPI0011AF7B98|nr:DUF6088 family protein [Vibrio diazotrophicus]
MDRSVSYRKTVLQKIENKIKYIKKGTLFSIRNYYHLGSESSVHIAFGKLIQDGIIFRMQRGIYCRPKRLKSIPSIITLASANQLAHFCSRENKSKLLPQGMEEAYRLGFQTQMPVRTVYWTNNMNREFKVGNQVVVVKKVEDKLLKWGNKPAGRLLRALSTFTRRPSDKKLKEAFSRLQLSEDEGHKLIINIYKHLRL